LLFVSTCKHAFCTDCIHEYIKIDLKEGKVLKCPLFSECSYEFNSHEVQALCEKNDSEMYNNQMLARVLTSMQNVIGCPAPGCKNYVEVVDKTKKLLVPCECGMKFCSICKRDYHYEISCEELTVVHQKWVEWVTKNRTLYHISQKNANVLRTDYEKEKTRIDKENYAVQSVFDNLVKDEKWKEENCKVCPKCRRAVQKLEGCDKMICGRDFHGGNAQDGCGKHFDWKKAKNYTTLIPKRPNGLIDIPPPPVPNSIVHPSYITCDSCRERVVGLLFKCIHCSGFYLCEKCEFKSHPNHLCKLNIFKIIETAEPDLTDNTSTHQSIITSPSSHTIPKINEKKIALSNDRYDTRRTWSKKRKIY